jgi:hypothetical protein
MNMSLVLIIVIVLYCDKAATMHANIGRVCENEGWQCVGAWLTLDSLHQRCTDPLQSSFSGCLLKSHRRRLLRSTNKLPEQSVLKRACYLGYRVKEASKNKGSVSAVGRFGSHGMPLHI